MSKEEFIPTRDWYVPPRNAKTPLETPLDPADVAVPTRRYTDPDYLQNEFDLLWTRTWQLACRESQVSNPGDYLVYDIGKRSYLIVRGTDGQVRAFYNSCRHRGTRLCNGRGNTGKSMKCPYHMWSYGLDGSLQAVTDRETFCPIEDADYGLSEVAVGTCAGFIFLHPDRTPAESLTEFLGDVPALLEPYRFEEAVTTLDVTMPCSANWKVLVEAFVEMYHVQTVHPHLLATLDDVNTYFENLGRHSWMIVPTAVTSERLGGTVSEIDRLEGVISIMADGVGVRSRENRSAGEETAAALRQMFTNEAGELELPEGSSVRDVFVEMAQNALKEKGFDLSGLSAAQFLDDHQFHVFPNVIMNCYAGLNMFLRFRPHATDPGQCLIDLMLIELIKDPDEIKSRTAVHQEYAEGEISLGEVIDQDTDFLPEVQAGLAGGDLENVTLSKQEIRIVNFHKALDGYIPDRNA
ncbi:MAG: aromatic ring-hydroxylating dioxygenase subunit alpha [Myxococcales bacterium]|nr:aromatic ring-hydroxylating dioxygenase subunit alpha [Myxococcales bacterium]